MRAENTNPILALSPTIRQHVTLPCLDSGEEKELLADVNELIGWLQEIQFKEQDFIRQALIDGLISFQFCLTHIKWVGFGYTLESLKEVIGAYMALEKGIETQPEAPSSSAALKKVSILCKKFYDKIDATRKFKSNSEFMLELYGAGALLLDGQKITGLLTHSS